MPRRNPERPTHIGLGSEKDSQMSLFAVTPTPVGLGARDAGPERQTRRRAPAQRDSAKEPAPAWAAYNGPHVPCGIGTLLHHNGAAGAHLTGARYARTFRGERALYCTGCATTQRAADGLSGGLPARAGRR